MKKKALNRALGTCVVSVALCGIGAGNVLAQDSGSGIFDSPFDRCFENGYNVDLVTVDQAFATAECFTSLIEPGDSGYLGASEATIMQYSASWYEAAARKGHKLAANKYETNLLALNAMDHQKSMSLNGDQQSMLASEQVFKSMDIDNDGLLTVAEVNVGELKASFAKTDIDSDGVLSYGEYTIYSGDATAAGN